MSTDRPSSGPQDPEHLHPESHRSDFPRQTLPAITPDVAIADKPSPVKLKSGVSVAVLQSGADERVEIRSASGDMILSMRMTDQGPVFCLSGATFEIAATRALSLTAETIHLEAHGDLTLAAGGTLRAGGRDVALAADPGQVSIHANDDVDIVGERVRLNSEDPPMPESMEEHRSRRAIVFEPFSGPISPPGLDSGGGGRD